MPARLLAIGSSTGGPQALFTLVQGLGEALPVPVVLTQHMPPTFTPILAEHITKLGGMPCAEAQHGETMQPGASISPPAIGICWSNAPPAGCRRGCPTTRRRISAAPRSTRCCAAPPPPATDACWW